MTEICRMRIDHPSAWRGRDFKSKDDFSFDLQPLHQTAIDKAMARIREGKLGLDDIEREHFELEDVAADLAGLARELRDGRGFVMIRGFPRDRYSADELGIIYWGIGTHFGKGVSQSVMGDRLGHVKDFSKDDPNARAYRHNKELTLHTDLSDIVALLSLSAAAVGGRSQFASMTTVHNEVLANHPEYLEPLYRGFRYHRAGEEAHGEEPVTPWRVPIFAYINGRLSSRYIRGYLERGMAVLGEGLSDLERAALDYVDEVAKREQVDMLIEPGEAVFQNNFVVLHSRTGFKDDEAAGKVRHLLRLWLDVKDNPYPSIKEMHIHKTAGIQRVEGKRPSGEGDAYLALVKAREARETAGRR